MSLYNQVYLVWCLKTSAVRQWSQVRVLPDRISFSNDGGCITIYKGSDCIYVKARTIRGGYMVDSVLLPKDFTDTDEMINHAAALIDERGWTKCPDRYGNPRSKSELPDPLGFDDEWYYTDGRSIISRSILMSASVVGVVSISPNCRVSDAVVPSEDAWWMLECRAHSGKRLTLIINDELKYYYVSRSERVMGTSDAKTLDSVDKMLIEKAIKHYLGEKHG